MGKYTIRDVEFEIDVPLELDPRRSFEITADSFADLKQAGRDLQKQIAEEFDVDVSQVRYKRGGKLKNNQFLVY
jgi:hypothetical protein